MGIDVWLRRPNAAELEQRAAPAQASEAEPTPRPATKAQPPSRPADVAAHRSPQTPDAAQEAPVEVERFSLVCIRTSHAILISDPLDNPAHRRLAGDIAASVGIALRLPTEKARQLEFRFPQVEGAGGDWRRSLAAFLTKQQAVGEPRLLLLTRGARPRFEGWLEHPALEMDELAELATDAGRKRALWQQIQQRLEA